MGNAIWLFCALPIWYFSTVLHPLSAGPLTFVPAFGALSLAVGVVIAIRRRQSELTLFAIPFVFSEAFVTAAGAFRGKIAGTTAHSLIVAFIVTQFMIVMYFIYLMKFARTPAIALAVFSATYAALACFVAAMSFSDVWV